MKGGAAKEAIRRCRSAEVNNLVPGGSQGQILALLDLEHITQKLRIPANERLGIECGVRGMILAGTPSAERRSVRVWRPHVRV